MKFKLKTVAYHSPHKKITKEFQYSSVGERQSVCVCVCVCERERERERNDASARWRKFTTKSAGLLSISLKLFEIKLTTIRIKQE